MWSRLILQHAGEKRSYRCPSGKVGSTNTHLSGCDLPEAEHTTFVRKTVHSTPCGANAKAALPLQALAPSQAGFQGPETPTEGTVYQGFVLFQ